MGKDVRGPVSCLTLALAACALLGGLTVSGPVRAQAKPGELQENSLPSAIDGFVAYLRSEAYDVASEAARTARDNKDAIDAAEATLRSHLVKLGAALSGRKERAETLANDAMARLDVWSKSAGVSWAEARRQAEQLLDSFTVWLRSQAPSNETDKIRV
jgi:hypothetical protein